MIRIDENGDPYIDCYEEMDLQELIEDLIELVQRGKTHMTIDSKIEGDGMGSDGSDVYEYIESQLTFKQNQCQRN